MFGRLSGPGDRWRLHSTYEMIALHDSAAYPWVMCLGRHHGRAFALPIDRLSSEGFTAVSPATRLDL